ncbi:transglutaminase family protein [Novosphingobium cyanobacteriorum]|uniref:Transglutaminase family protein n=1 Tax=Novosphingobium cyanobacteriorum TaxID=3024215 RepID=A0ABT6CGU7_9SPHN|nr:transglutaminase family protein [Novosphingobium cyanobacteriorum]MDF8333042.1 transglutaminase family protein [Novosphingobium cyanobacteriorum]
MIYEVRHVTTVNYASPVQLARFNLRLTPAPWPGQVLHEHALMIDPMPSAMEEDEGPFVVHRARIAMREPLGHIEIESHFRMEVSEPSFDLDMAVAPTVAQVREAAAAHRDLCAMGPASYLYPSPMAPLSPAITQWAAPMLQPGASILDAGRALMHAIHAEFTYDGAATTADTPPDEAFEARHGVCQDFAHVMIVAARGHGIPASYISGYLRTLPPPGQPRLVGADATHAWAALWCGEDLGWVGFDPTNDCLVKTDHIFTAMGRDYADVAPMDGVFRGGAGQTMTVSVDVEPVG